jgi:hypothetical protein
LILWSKVLTRLKKRMPVLKLMRDSRRQGRRRNRYAPKYTIVACVSDIDDHPWYRNLPFFLGMSQKTSIYRNCENGGYAKSKHPHALVPTAM